MDNSLVHIIMIIGEVIVHSINMVRNQEDGGIRIVITLTSTTITKRKEVGGFVHLANKWYDPNFIKMKIRPVNCVI